MNLVSRTESATHIVTRYESEDGRTVCTLVTETTPLPITTSRETPRIHHGQHWHDAAARVGLEDEYIDGMVNRFGTD